MADITKRLSNADDIYFGTDASEDILGLNGSDWIFGGGGDDRLYSNDEYSFSAWLDRTLTDRVSYIDGGEGNDEIESFGTDIAYGIGGSGHDEVIARSYGEAYGRGGDGNDLLGVSSERGDAWAYGGVGNDFISVKARYAYAYASGGAGDDEISIDRSLRAKVSGGAGDDLLVVTDALPEQVTILVGGTGKDIMQGGSEGTEIYRFGTNHTGVGERADEIRYFAEEDVIDLSRIDANGAEPGEGSFVWAGNAQKPELGQLSYYQIEVDGVGATVLAFDYGEGVREILLTNLEDPVLAADDFML